MKESDLLYLLKVQSNLGPSDFEEIFLDKERARHLFNVFARESWNLISFIFNKINGEERERFLEYVNKELLKFTETKTKCIQITTTDTEGFSEMSGLVGAIDKLTKNLDANYKIDYFFK